MNKIIELDKFFFKYINHNLSNSFFDELMPWLRNSMVWTPFYLLILLLIVSNVKKNGWYIVMFIIGTVVITDFISSKLIKPYFMRIRPCHNPDFKDWINILVGHLPGNGSFTSSHATNHFGFAALLHTIFKQKYKWISFLYFWAFSISFAQVYVGVHYPLDIIGGGILGCLIGYLCGKQFNKTYSLE